MGGASRNDMMRELLLMNTHLGDPVLEQLTKDFVQESLSSSQQKNKGIDLDLLLQLHWHFYKYHQPKSLAADSLGSAIKSCIDS